MARVIALTQAQLRTARAEILRGSLVYGCALALIAAGHALPF